MLASVRNHYQLAENLLCYAASEKDLGVFIYSTLNFNGHCEKLLNKANQQYELLKRTYHFVTNMKRRRVLYLTLVSGQLKHCSQVYLHKCKQINILPLVYRFKLNDMIFFHKIVYNNIPINLPSYLTFYNDNSRLRSTHLDSLSLVYTLPIINTHGLDKSFFFRSHTAWNLLPYNIFDLRNATKLSEFKQN